jgi:hypothetical protein
VCSVCAPEPKYGRGRWRTGRTGRRCLVSFPGWLRPLRRQGLADSGNWAGSALVGTRRRQVRRRAGSDELVQKVVVTGHGGSPLEGGLARVEYPCRVSMCRLQVRSRDGACRRNIARSLWDSVGRRDLEGCP